MAGNPWATSGAVPPPVNLPVPATPPGVASPMQGFQSPTADAIPQTIWQRMSDDELKQRASTYPGAAAEAKRRSLRVTTPLEDFGTWLTETSKQGMSQASDEQIRKMAETGFGGAQSGMDIPPTGAMPPPTMDPGMLPAPDGFSPRAVPRPTPPPPSMMAPPAGPPGAVPQPPPGDFAGGMQAMVDPRAMPRPSRFTGGGGMMADIPSNPPPTSPSAFEAFRNDPDKMANLRDFGLRMMMAGEAQPGSAIGPSLFGAVGRAGMGTVQDVRARKAGAATAATEQKRFEKKMEMEERKIESTEALRRETMKLRAEGQQAANDIAAARLKTDRGTLEVSIATKEDKARSDLRDSQDYMIAEEADKQRMESTLTETYNRIRVANGFEPQGGGNAAPDGPTATNSQTGEKMILRNGQWVPM